MDDPNTTYCDGIRWLSVDDLVKLNQQLIERYTPSEKAGVFNLGLLESAHMRPAEWAYRAQSRDMACIAAMAMIAICLNHPFHNANKRTAFAAGRMLMLMNGYHFDPPGVEVLEVMVEIAKGEDPTFRDPTYLGSWVADHATRAPLDDLPLETAYEYVLGGNDETGT
ncbi:MAG: type II toxin-antitoxin system death-on-curing family toxin [Billgrantia sp.]